MPARDTLEGLTPRDLVLLRIWEVHRSARTEFDMRSATREGLAGFFSVSATRTSRDLKRLQSSGLIAKRASEVRARRRRVVVYTPTASGQNAAARLAFRLAAMPVASGDSVGSLEDLVRDLPVKIGLAGAARFVRSGKFDRDACLKLELGRVAAITGRGQLPQTAQDFVGRAGEIDRLRAHIVNRSGGPLVVEGIPGIGKTTTLVQAVRGIAKGEPVFWHEFVEGANARALLKALAYYLLQRDRPLLERFLSALPEANLEEAIPVLRREFGGIPSLLVFDNFHRADTDALGLMAQILAMSANNRALKCVLVTRDGPFAVKFAGVHSPDAACLTTIPPLEIEEAKGLWRRLGGKMEFEQAWEAVAGHPHLLTLAASLEGEIEPLVRLATEHLGRWLDEDEREALEAVAVFRHPVPLDALHDMKLGDHSSLRRLVEKRFLLEARGGLVTIHDSIREAALAGIGEKRKASLDSGAARFWAGIGGPVALEEASFHLARAGKVAPIREFLASQGRVLAGAGYASTVEKLLNIASGSKDSMTAQVGDPDSAAELLLLGGTVKALQGRLEEAEKMYGEVIGLRRAPEWAVVRARVEAATMLQRLGRRAEAGERLSGLMIPVDAPAYEEARLLHHIGSTYEVLDDYARAEKFHRQCAAVPSSNAKALSYLGLGRVLWRQRRHEGAMAEFKAAESEAKAAGEVETLINALLFQGDCLCRQGYSPDGNDNVFFMHEAEIVTNRALAIASESGHERFVGYCKNNLSDFVARQGRLDEARALAEDALRFFEETREPIMIGQAKACLANVCVMNDEAEKALQLAQEIAQISRDSLPKDACDRLDEMVRWYEAEAKRVLAKRSRPEPDTQREKKFGPPKIFEGDVG